MRLQWRALLVFGGGDVLDDVLEQRLKVVVVRQAAVLGLVDGRVAGLRRAVDDRQVKQVVKVEVDAFLDDILGEAQQQVVDSETTSSMRASGRSTLLTHRITGSLASRALRSTKRVCGSGPSEASTSSTTPSTMEMPRSTSPPKSAWPGVSMMLSVMPSG